MSERRILLVTERAVGAQDRASYIETLRATRTRCAEQGVHFWAFEHATDAGRYVEFAEAKDVAPLEALGLHAPPAEAWHSLELT
jgi:hypothetical protein